MNTNVSTLLSQLVKLLSLFSKLPVLGKVPWVETLLGLANALLASPQLLEWLQKLFSTVASTPDEAMPMLDLTNDQDLKTAIEGSPEFLSWAKAEQGIPEGAEGIGFAGLFSLVKWLPTLITLLKGVAELPGAGK